MCTRTPAGLLPAVVPDVLRAGRQLLQQLSVIILARGNMLNLHKSAPIDVTVTTSRPEH